MKSAQPTAGKNSYCIVRDEGGHDLPLKRPPIETAREDRRGSRDAQRGQDCRCAAQEVHLRAQ